MSGSVGALTGVRVLDLADETGAYAGKLLADMGADVVKIEPPGGDPTRTLGPFYEGGAGGSAVSPTRALPLPESGDERRNRSLFFWHYHTNKRSVVLDLAQAEGRDRFARLAATADIIVETHAPGHLDTLGIGYAQLAQANPGLIVVSLTPFGQNGPYRDWRTSDTVAQALGGMLFVNGHADEPPLRSLGLQAYHSASTYAAIGAMLALLARARTGRGQHVDVSLQECVVATLENVSGYFHQTGAIEVRRGTLHWTRYFRVVKCRDGYALHCTLGDWTSLIEWVKMDGKAQELAGPEWEDFNHRRRNCVRLFDVLDEWAKDYRVADLMEGAQLRRIPYASVLPPEALPQNVQLVARGFFVPVAHPELRRTLMYPGAPYQFSDSRWAIRHRAPLLGEHTDEVLAELVAGGESPIADEAAHPADRTALVDEERAETGHWPSARGDRRALCGIRIIDFTWVVAGPVATRILADQGAEVIKIERRDSLDFGSRRGGLTGNLNRGKQSIVLNMADPRGVALAKRLVATADVVVDNFSARVMRNWGLDYESLRAINPQIIAVSMSGFGHTGPQKDYVSYGPTLQALSGYTLLMRHPGREPAGWGFSYSDMAGGYHAALAVLFALWHRRNTGRGQFVDLSQLESVTALLGPLLLDVVANGATIAPFGNRSQERPGAPHGVYRCRDEHRDPSGSHEPTRVPLLTKEGLGEVGTPGRQPPVVPLGKGNGSPVATDRWCAITVFGDDDWARFCRAIGEPAWSRAARFATLGDRLAHHDELDQLVAAWTRERTAEEVMYTLQRAGVAAGVVNNARDLCERDAQLQARGYWASVPTPEGEIVKFDGLPVRLSATPGRVAGPGPLLGEHTDAVLERLLQLSAHEVAGLRADHIVGERSTGGGSI